MIILEVMHVSGLYMICGGLWKPRDQEAIEKVKSILGSGREYLEKDVINVVTAYLLKKGYIKVTDRSGRDHTKEYLEAFENTMKLTGITWEMIEEFMNEEEREE